MMLKREPTPQEGSGPAARKRGNRTGSSVFAVLAGVAMVCTGAIAAALAGSHAVAAASTSTQCQPLPTAASSPAPSPTSTATAGPDSSSLPSVSSTPNTAATTLCVTVAAQASSVNSGQDAYYTITVHPTGNTADDVTVQLSAYSSDSSPGPGTPAFTVCGNGDGTQTCTLGTMHTSQSTQLQAEIAIPSSAPTGETFTLSAKVTGAAPNATTSGSVTGSAASSAEAPAPKSSSPSPSSSGHHSSGSGQHHSGSGTNSGSGGGSGSNGSGSNGSSGTNRNTDPLAGLPPLTTSGGSNPLLGTGTDTGNAGGLFPTISPSSGASVPPAAGTGSKPQRPYKATTVADVLPLNPSQLSTQVAGLVVLGIGIILVFARISLRRPKSSQTK